MFETDNKSPSAMTTRPLGNSYIKPTPLDRIIGANAAAKLRQINPDARRAVDDMIARKEQQGGGHARD
jgi:hypothetical protein